jgi:hypothetical protein
VAKPVITYKSSNYVTTAGPTFTASPTWTPQANSLLVALSVGCSASPTDPTGITGHGLTYTKITIPTATLSTTHIMSIWVANAGASPSSVAEVASFGGTPTGNALICFEITGWESDEPISNAFGTGTLINTATGTATTGTVNLSLRPDVTGEHVQLSFFLHLANEATTPRASWTETAGADGNFNTPATGAEAQFRTDVFELTSTATWTTSSLYRGLALVVRGTDTTPTETLKLGDGPVTARLNPQPVLVAAESLKVQDILDNPVITGSPPLSIVVTAESLKVSASGRIDLFGLGSALRLGDTMPPTAHFDPRDVAIAPEGLRLADTLSAQLTVLNRVVPAEALELTDTTWGEGWAELSHDETIRISDTVSATVGAGADLSVLVTDESLKLADPVTAILPIQETLRLSASGRIDLIGLGAALKLGDTVTAALVGGAPDLTCAIPDDVLKVQDTVSASLTVLQVALTGEALTVQDTLQASSGVLLGTPADESLKVQDALSASLTVLQVAVADEPLKVQDSLQASSGGLLATPSDEALKVQDPVGAQLTVLQPAVLTEALKVQDSVTGQLDTLQVTVGAESLKVQDTLLASSGGLLASPPDENLKVQDTLSAQLTVLQRQLTDETLRLGDTANGELTPLLVTIGAESLKLADQVTAGSNPAVSVTQEAIKVSDALTGQLDTLEANLSESVRIADTVTALSGLAVLVAESIRILESTPVGRLDPLQQTPTESLHVVDTLTVVLFDFTALNANLTEIVHLQDMILGPPVREYFIVPVQDRWFVVPAKGREFTP